jgi:hypothetical protein
LTAAVSDQDGKPQVAIFAGPQTSVLAGKVTAFNNKTINNRQFPDLGAISYCNFGAISCCSLKFQMEAHRISAAAQITPNGRRTLATISVQRDEEADHG